MTDDDTTPFLDGGDNGDHGLGWIESPPDDRDWPIDALYAVTGVDVPDTLPVAYVVPAPHPPVLNQGSSPMCVAYSSSRQKAYQDLRDQGSFDFDEQTFFMRIGGTANGALIRNAMNQMLTAGYPVVGLDRAAQHKIASYYSVPVSRADICAALIAFGPLVAGMPWPQSWMRSPENPGGVLPASSTLLAGGHAVDLDGGYNAIGVTGTNSWGSVWGDNGRFTIPWSYLPHIREVWKAVDVIEPKPTPKPVSWTLHIAHGATVLIATVTSTGKISGWTKRPWTSPASSAPCRRPVIKLGTHSGQATVAYVTKGVFAACWIRIGSGTTVTHT